MTAATSNPARVDWREWSDELRSRATQWMQSAVFAREAPDDVVIYSERGARTHAQLHMNANRIADVLRRTGLRPGDSAALMCRNRPEFIEVFLACMRAGLRLAPINTHLRAAEAAYIAADCGAGALFLEAELASEEEFRSLRAAHTFSIGGALEGAACYDEALASANAEDPPPTPCGRMMLYTSGTTGRPKAVVRPHAEIIEPQFAGTFAEYRPGDANLLCGPAYHAAPLLFDIRWPLASGATIVMMEKWDSLQALALIERHRITHTHMVPTMFQRLLALPALQRTGYDLSSLRFLVHGAAPCPIPVKRAMIEWLGPILIEYYGATEGGHGINIRSDEWLRKPGAVGRIDPALGHVILDEHGREAPRGQVGRLFLRAPVENRFEYYNDAQKTAGAYLHDRFTLGDMGYIDEDGYLFLTGRAAECIISGGVNIYPQEIDAVLLEHEAVADVCTVGAPDEEWGERVISVVALRPGHERSAALAEALIAFAGSKLAKFKRPRQIDFVDELPRSASGKLLRQRVREHYWRDSGRQI